MSLFGFDFWSVMPNKECSHGIPCDFRTAIRWMWASRILEIVSLREVFTIAMVLAGWIERGDGDRDPRPNCPSDKRCNQLGADCVNCNFSIFGYDPNSGKAPTCKYGDLLQVPCTVRDSFTCQGERNFTKGMKCSYCYQIDPQFYTCNPVTNCSVIAPPPDDLKETECTVDENVLCFGHRRFLKKVPCRWTTGRYKWSTAVILSITLGGFGVDRFYLGLWRSGLGKLFSFGGLGVWTIIDVILIATGYVGPADNTLYMY